MNNNQKLFCHEYVKNGNNGMKAYMEVYNVKEETAMTNSSRLLRNAKVLEYIESLQNELKDETIMSAKERMEWLSKVVYGEITEKQAVFTDNDVVVKDVETSINNKIKALDTLNKMSGEYVTKIEGDIGATIKVDIDE